MLKKSTPTSDPKPHSCCFVGPIFFFLDFDLNKLKKIPHDSVVLAVTF